MSFVAVAVAQMGAVVRRAFPDALWEPGWGLLRPVRIEITELPLGEADRMRLASAASGGRRVRVVIADRALLRRSFSLPRSAVPRAGDAIAVAMRQAFPAQATGLVWCPVPERYDGGTAHYSVLIAKRDHLAGAVDAVERAGGTVAGIEVAGAGLLQEDNGGRKMRRRWMVASGILVLVLFGFEIATLQMRLSRLQREVDVRSTELAELEARAVVLRTQRDKQTLTEASLRDDYAVFNAGRGRASVLLSLSSALPDDVWLSELTMTQGELFLSGFALREVPDVVGALQSLKDIDAPQLAGPSVIDSLSGATRFQIRASLRSGEEG